MSAYPRQFAAELRADAQALRTMADTLEQRAAACEAQDPPHVQTSLEHMAFCMNMTPEAYRLYLRRLGRAKPRYADDVHDFRGTGHIGSAHRPELVIG